MNQHNLEEAEKQTISDKDIFLEIWASPRRILKYINDNKYDKFLYALLIIAGIVRAFDRAVDRDLGDRMSLTGIIFLSIFVGGLLGWLSYYIYAALIRWTGQWLDGKGDTKSILRMLAYASIPSILTLSLLIPQIIVYGAELFKSEGDITSAGLVRNLIFYGALFFELVMVIYTFVFVLVGISEVQKFNKWKAFLNMMLPILIFALPLMLIFLIADMG